MFYRNHNWYQGLTQAVPPIKIPDSADEALKIKQSASALQQARVGFYHSVIKMTRLLGGDILISKSQSTEALQVQAILLWLPAHHQLSALPVITLYQSGFFKVMWDYGVRGVYKVLFVYEDDVHKMFKKAGTNVEDGALVQMLVANPEFNGHGYASKLLWWKMQHHWAENPGIDVHLDTGSDYGQKVYERLGFATIGKMYVHSGTDADGFALPKNNGQTTDEHGIQSHWIMKMRNPNR